MKKRLVAMLILIVLSLSLFTGCSVITGGKTKDITLKWVMMGPGMQADSKIVWEKFNKDLQAFLPGVKVDFEIISGADYGEKYKLMMSAQEPVDIVWLGWMLDRNTEARNGAYADLGPLMDKYAPELKKELDPWLWDLATVDGKIFSVPNYQMYNNSMYALATTKALADAYIKVDETKKNLTKDKKLTEDSYKAIDDYLKSLKDAGKIAQGMTAFFPQYLKGFEDFGGFVMDREDSSFKIQYKWLTDEAKTMFIKYGEWFQKGYVRKDVLSMQNPRQDDNKPNGASLWSVAYLNPEDTAKQLEKQSGIPVELLPMQDDLFISSTAVSSATAIVETSKNKEAAIKLIELMNTPKGKALYNLLVYGIEGTHYNKVSDNRIKQLIAVPGSPGANDKYGLTKWAVGNTYYAYETQVDIEGYNDFVKRDINGKAVVSKFAAFKPNVEKVRTEMAQVTAVATEYSKQLLSGALPNVEQTYNEFKTKLENAGIRKIEAEYQAQIDAFVKERNIK